MMMNDITTDDEGIMYHVTPNGNVASILHDGLIPAIGPRSEELGESVPAVYMFSDKASLMDATWLAEEFEEEDVTVLEIRHHHPDHDFYETISTEPITPTDITVSTIEF